MFFPTAYCKNPVDQRWYDFDDSKVTEVGQQEVVTRSAYLLFYQRRQLADKNLEELNRGQHWVYRLSRNPENSSVNRQEMNKLDRDSDSRQSLSQSLPRRTDIFTTPQQSRRQISSVQSIAKQAWSTPQPQRKYSHHMDHDKSPSNFSRQNSIPSKSRPHSGEHNKLDKDFLTSLRVNLPPCKPENTISQTPSSPSDDRSHMTCPPSTPISTEKGPPITMMSGSPATIQINKVALPPLSNVTNNATKQSSPVTMATNRLNSNQDSPDSKTISDSAGQHTARTPVQNSETKTQKLSPPSSFASQNRNHPVNNTDTETKTVKEILASSQFGSPRNGHNCDSVISWPVVPQQSFPTSMPVTNGIPKHMVTGVKEHTAKRSLNQTFQQINNGLYLLNNNSLLFVQY